MNNIQIIYNTHDNTYVYVDSIETYPLDESVQELKEVVVDDIELAQLEAGYEITFDDSDNIVLTDVAEKLTATEVREKALQNLTIEHKGANYQFSPTSRQNINDSITVLIAMGQPSEYEIVWKDADNNPQSITKGDLATILFLGMQAVSSLYQVSQPTN